MPKKLGRVVLKLPNDSAERKRIPLATGVLDFFSDALIEVAKVSHCGSEQHNPGKPVHWDRLKSTDEADAMLRHFIERGGVDIDGLLHSAKMSWRALALLQKELEKRGHPLKFGKRTVLGIADRTGGRTRWRTRCECGHESICLTQDLKSGRGCRYCSFKGPRISRRNRPYEWRYNAAVNRARHPFVITYEEFFEFTKIKNCHYCGELIDWGPSFGQNRRSGLNLDRKDNNLPYVKDNLVVACRRCNYGKNNFFSYAEWKELGALIRSWRNR